MLIIIYDDDHIPSPSLVEGDLNTFRADLLRTGSKRGGNPVEAQGLWIVNFCYGRKCNSIDVQNIDESCPCLFLCGCRNGILHD